MPDSAARSSLSEAIYAGLRMALMSGSYEPGDRINIRKLALLSRTSPTPVREAIMQLVREGALELKPGYQPRVPILSPERYEKIREVRAPLERLAAELAAQHAPPELAEALLRLDQRFIEAERDGDWKAATGANQEFHFAIYRASRNEVLVRAIESLWLLTGPVVHSQYAANARRPPRTALHGQIIDALCRHAAQEAGDLVVQDMRQGAAVILEHLRAPGPKRRAGRRAASQPGA